jgi:hypothetical protein
MRFKLANSWKNMASKLAVALSIGLLCCACQSQTTEQVDSSETQSSNRYFIIGQDLGAVREYQQSGCCVRADGNTAYINLYNVLDESFSFNGLGIDPYGEPLDVEIDPGAGPINLRKSATEFAGEMGGILAIGLELVENSHPGAMKALIAGEYDPQIAQFARFLKIIEGSVWLRVGYEFDGFWNEGYEDAAQYVSAYRYVVDNLRMAGVNNVEYIWQSSTSPVDDLFEEKHEDISSWYPGDDYVDWVASSWFRGIDEGPTTKPDYTPSTQGQLTDEVLAFARAHNKPVLIAESSPQGFDLANNFKADHVDIWDGPPSQNKVQMSSTEIWEAWYAPLFAYMNRNKDVIRGFAYINDNWDARPRWGAPYSDGYWGDSRLQVNPEIAERFNQAVTEWRIQ